MRTTRPPFGFARGRTALLLGLEHLGLTHGDGLLLPDFICEVVLHTLAALGVEPEYYPLTEDLCPDWPAMEEAVTDKTRAVLMVHYFGQPQDTGEYRRFCARHDLHLVEDNAHGFGGSLGGRSLGTLGDVGFSSPHKSFPIRSGAYLHVGSDLPPLAVPRLPLEPESASVGKVLLRRAVFGLPAIGTAATRLDALLRPEHGGTWNPESYADPDAFRQGLRGDFAMDSDSHRLLCSQNLAEVRRKRQEIYRIWEAWSRNLELSPAFSELARGAMPLVFPAYANDADEARTWFRRGFEARIDVHSWPTLPRAIVDQGGPAFDRWRRLVCFPIHQQIDPSELRKRIERF